MMNKHFLLMLISIGFLFSTIINIVGFLVNKEYGLAAFTVIPSAAFVYLMQENYKHWMEKRSNQPKEE